MHGSRSPRVGGARRNAERREAARSTRLWEGAPACASNQRHGRSKAGEDVIRADRSKRAARPASPGPEALPPGSLRAGRKGRSSGTARDGRPPRSPKGTRNLRIEHGSAPFHNRALRTGAETARARSWKALAKLINPRTRWRETQPADPGSAGSVDSRERLPTLGAATTAPPLRRQEAGSRKSRRRPRVAPEGAPLGPVDARPEHPPGGFTHPSSITGSAYGPFMGKPVQSHPRPSARTRACARPRSTLNSVGRLARDARCNTK